MNRRGRRTSAAKARRELTSLDISNLSALATGAYGNGRPEEAEVISKKILANVPLHRESLMLLGAIYQNSGRHRLAIKQFLRAIALNSFDPICHYNIACSYQILGEFPAARGHFTKAVQLGIGVEEFTAHNPTVLTCIRRIKKPFTSSIGEAVIDPKDLVSIANDLFLQCALRLTLVRSVELELFLTELRQTLLRLVIETPVAITDDVAGLLCALAQQCFINEYVFAQKADEAQLAEKLRNLMLQRMVTGEKISVSILSAVAAYFPLHRLPEAKKLSSAQWPEWAADLITQQIDEVFEERRDQLNIPELTTIDNDTSIQVMRQYEENPYPRWTINRLAAMSDEDKRREGRLHSGRSPPKTILIAGCGSGQHACEMAQYFPDADILAIDLSRASLAYGKRKAREQKISNIKWGQADLLKLDKINGFFDRVVNGFFDRVECVGVLHHLADPFEGWRLLLKLLKPDGIMRIGLYSKSARRSVSRARELAAASGFSVEDIREFRQVLIRDSNEKRWQTLFNGLDFYSVSGCRDLIFNVMEHRFSIPQIATFLTENHLSFLGFELPDRIMEQFHAQHSAANAALDLKIWDVFEQSNPNAFRPMYIFSVVKS